MVQNDTKLTNEKISPSQSDQGVTTAPTLTATEEVEALRIEVTRLKRALELASSDTGPSDNYPKEIDYGSAPISGARLMGLTKDRDHVRPSTDFPELPQPTINQSELEADFMRWGYCVIKDAQSQEQIRAQVDRLLDQAAAERAAGVAHMSHHGHAQLVFNMLPKGQVFRDLIAFEASATQQGPLIETLLTKILGTGWYLGTTHGSIVHERGGLQELHQDQGSFPLPHPPFPLFCLIIWTFTKFGKEEGGTYLVPGSHRDAMGRNRVRPGQEYEQLAKDRLVALTVPAGCAVLTDSRLLHSGGKRTAPGTRLGMRNLYCKGMIRQQENQFISVSDEEMAKISPKLKQMMGYKPHHSYGMVDGNVVDPDRWKVHIGELSMSRPEEFNQDFDWRYSKNAKQLASQDWETYVDYRGN